MRKAHIWQLRIIGILGITLPFAVLLIGQAGSNSPDWYYSISASAYTNAAPWFVSTMGASGWFLIAYSLYVREEYGKWDFAVNFAAGFFALLIAFFPCYTTLVSFAGLIPLPIKVCSAIHNSSAALFFLLLAIDLLFFFTKNSGLMTKEKRRRNVIYRICGTGILVFMVIQAYTSFIVNLDGPYTMVNEALMLIFNGVGRFVKGETISRDRNFRRCR
ncbi:MAG: hypothetical protein LBH43_12940 [Treponema sp.]|jgi:hypothetical protein|nr:hypothetical protein [Treponema sp.]